MHALVPAVLLGMSGPDALDADAQAQPPDGWLGKVEQRIVGGASDVKTFAKTPMGCFVARRRDVNLACRRRR
jgi:hypothetical protein